MSQSKQDSKRIWSKDEFEAFCLHNLSIECTTLLKNYVAFREMAYYDSGYASGVEEGTMMERSRWE